MKKIEIITTIFEYDTDEGLTDVERKLIAEAKKIAEKAYSPYSGFNVGACVLLESGELVCANNQENAAYPSGICAERNAVFYANAKHPTQSVKAIAITAFNANGFVQNPIPPCGACIQVLLETEKRFGKPIKLILSGRKNVQIIKSVSQLLPLNFDKNKLTEG